jgi:hypothetical protein
VDSFHRRGCVEGQNFIDRVARVGILLQSGINAIIVANFERLAFALDLRIRSRLKEMATIIWLVLMVLLVVVLIEAGTRLWRRDHHGARGPGA